MESKCCGRDTPAEGRGSMIELILELLQKLQITEYLIEENRVESAELFFVKRELDMHREKKTVNWNVTVYRDFTEEKEGKALTRKGSSLVSLHPGMTKEEAERILAGAKESASYVKNPYYELPNGTKEEPVIVRSGLNECSLTEAAVRMVKALYAPDTEPDAFVNSSEIFAECLRRRILSSGGTDVSYEKRTVKGEFVVQCKEPQDVEMYHSFRYDEPDTDSLTKQVQEALSLIRLRAAAVKTPATGNYRVLLTNPDVGDLFRYYLDRASSSMIYPKYSSYAAGTQVQGESVSGDRLTVTLKADVPYSREGIPMRDRVLLRDGRVETIQGGARFAYYLGIEPTGEYTNLSVESGSRTVDELISMACEDGSPCLEVVSFSCFEMDPMSGHFGGEIRLALLHENKTVTPVTGGSVSGLLMEAHGRMYLSLERRKNGRYDGPRAVLFEGVHVAGDEG